MSHTFRGTGVALVTPFREDGSVDYPALEMLVDHVISGGVNYLVALGTTAETPAMSDEEKKQVLAFIIKQNNKRVPVVCGIGGNNTAEVVNQLKTYDLTGVDGILSVVPYYNKPTQEGIYQHFKAIAQATELPIILYNVPGRTVANMLPSTTLRLANEFSNIVAIKEASGNMSQCMDLVQGRPAHFAVLSGDDDLVLPQVALGMDGVISVAANCYTKDFTGMVNAVLNGDYDTARSLHYKLLEGIRLLFADGNPAGVKFVLNEMSICKNTLRLPLVPATEATAEKTIQFLRTL
ncbi:4-hydroxy-tetrahydrodipicolinate synthase [Chitinophagaceae bacterium MMS25-I14]